MSLIIPVATIRAPVSGADVLVADLGYKFIGGATPPTDTFDEITELLRLMQSEDLRTEVTAGNLIINNGTTDLTAAQGVAYLDGEIIFNHQALGNVTQLQALADKLDLERRPDFTEASLAAGGTLYVNSATGNDTDNDGLTAGSPFATIRRATQLIGWHHDTTTPITIELADGHLETIDSTFIGLAAYITGFTAAIDSGVSIVSVTQADEEFIAINVVLPSGPYATDALRGANFIKFDSGAASGTQANIRANDATDTYVVGETRLYVHQDDVNSLKVPVATDTISTWRRGSTLNMDRNVICTGNPDLRFIDCNFTDDGPGNRILFALATEKVNLDNCFIQIRRVQAGAWGRFFCLRSYFACYGDSTNGQIQANNGTLNIFRGNVFDMDLNGVAGSKFPLFKSGSIVDVEGNNAWVGVEDGLIADGVQIYGARGSIGTHDVFAMIDSDQGWMLDLNGVGLSGGYQLPNMVGTLTGADSAGRMVTADNCACIAVGTAGGASNAFGTPNGPEAVSADGGTSDISWTDAGTRISDGKPPLVVNNRDATTDPTVTDDFSKGYRLGSNWLNKSTPESFVLTDGTVGAAVWTSTTASGSGITASQHKALRDLIHFIDSGPADGFTSGAFLEITPSGNPFPTSEIWYTDSGKTDKIVELTISYNANKTIATEVWEMYDTDGSTVLVTLTDTYAYSGVFVTDVTRTWS